VRGTAAAQSAGTSNSFTIEGGGDDDDEGGGAPGTVAKVLHDLTLPFNICFAFVPPTDYGGGWVCFCVALIFIGGVTALVGDLVALFGYCSTTARFSSSPSRPSRSSRSARACLARSRPRPRRSATARPAR
jgi:hypothetical protein